MPISIVTACMDREVNLLKVVNNWVNLNVNEIIIIDWSSKLDIEGKLISELVKIKSEGNSCRG